MFIQRSVRFGYPEKQLLPLARRLDKISDLSKPLQRECVAANSLKIKEHLHDTVKHFLRQLIDPRQPIHHCDQPVICLPCKYLDP